MRATYILAAIACILIAGCASEPETGPEAGRALLEDMAASMGGWEALSAIEHQELVTAGSDWEPLQALAPGEIRQINRFARTLTVDYNAQSLRLRFEGERSYPSPAPVVFAEVISGDAGAILTEDADGQTTASRMHESRCATRMRDLRRLPRQLPFVARDAADLTRTEDRTVEGQTYSVLRYTDGDNPVELLIDPFNNLPVQLTYTETDAFLGDTENAMVFTDWGPSQVVTQDADLQVRLPFGQIMLIDGERLRDEAFRNIINNGNLDPGTFEIPQEALEADEVGDRIPSQWMLRRVVMGLGTGGFGEPQSVQLDEVAPGVLHATGTSHHSLVVEMEDHVIVVEAPLFEERSLAVIDAIEERFPDKPIRYVVVTHYHVDHSGGVRAYAARGATVVAHESIVEFLAGVLERPSTIRPDSLSEETGVTPTVDSVSDTLDLTDGTRTVQIRHEPNEHAEGMVIAYLPNERLAFVSDLYSPPAPIAETNANAMAFYAAVMDAGLELDQVIGGHGAVGPLPSPESE